jgi:AcrR family transcriptional regulator
MTPTRLTIQPDEDEAGDDAAVVAVSHNAPYKHFASKEDLLAAVVSREFERQSATIAAMGKIAPGDALCRLAHSYIGWVRDYPARFKLAYADWSDETAELAGSAGKARAEYVALVARTQEAGQLPDGNPERMASLILALLRGACDLSLSGHLASTGKGAADPEELIEDLFVLLGNVEKRKRPARPAQSNRKAGRRSK